MKITRRAVLGTAGLGLLGAAGVGAIALGGEGGAVNPEGRSRARGVAGQQGHPSKADVVIIGAGNIGATAAYFLAQRGLQVVLCEKGAVAGEASGRSVGHVFSLGLPRNKLEVMVAANRLWPEINQQVGVETGYRRDGLLVQINSDHEREFWERWLSESKELVPDARLLSAAQAARLAPMRSQWLGGIYAPSDGRAEPTLYAPAMAEAARRLGAVIAAPCAARGIETSGGRISAVVTEFGRIATSAAVVAGGAWSTAFLWNAGIRLPVGNLFSWCASFYGVDGPATNAIFENTTWRRQIDGGFTTSLMSATAPITPMAMRFAKELFAAYEVGSAEWEIKPRLGKHFFEELLRPSTWRMDETSPFEMRRIFEPAPNSSVVEAALQKMRQNVPAFEKLRIGSTWGGVLSGTPDALPVLSTMSRVPGLVVATGFSEGLSMAPAAGKAVAAMVVGNQPDFDIRPYSIERFPH